MAGGHGNSLSQIGFRGRNDDGNETAATWKKGTNQDWWQRPDENFRVRITIHANGLAQTPGEMTLYTALNDFAYIQASSAALIDGTSTVHYAYGDDSTQQISSGAYETDNQGMVTGALITNGFSVGAGPIEESAEVEYCLQLAGSQLNDGDIVRLRCQFGAATLSQGYLEIPEIRVDIPHVIRKLIIIQ